MKPIKFFKSENDHFSEKYLKTSKNATKVQIN